MTQIWQGEEVVAVTKVQAGPCVVTQVKNEERDGYRGVQLGFEKRKEKNIKKPQKGHLAGLKKISDRIENNFRYLREIRPEKKGEEAPALEAGDVITANTFNEGDKIDVTGRSRGKGFQGVVKRHGFAGAIKTHGTKDQERMPGSAGAMGAARVFKGKKMPGRMGGDTVTTKNLEIVEVDAANNVIYIKGSIAGSPEDLLILQGKGELSKVSPEEVFSAPEKEAEQEAQPSEPAKEGTGEAPEEDAAPSQAETETEKEGAPVSAEAESEGGEETDSPAKEERGEQAEEQPQTK